MSILTEEEVNQLWIDHGLDECDPEGFARKVESAVLEKLAVMEMPPVPNLTQEEREFLHYNPNTGDLVDFVQGHAAAYGRQAFAQGAASQLSAEPVAHLRKNGFRFLGDFEPQDDSELPLYTLKEPK